MICLMSHTEIHSSVGSAFMTFSRRATGELPSLNAAEFEPDWHLKDAIGRGLRATGRSALRCIVIEVIRDAIVLQGRVPSYYEKQLAQATAQQCAANRQVVNEIEVICCR